MSHLSKVFNKVPVKVMDRSGFDMSHENLFSAKIGTLIPASVEEVLPGDVVSVGGAVSVELPPLATNFKGRLDAKLETFFVPNRIIWKGWQSFITQDINHNTSIPGYSIPGEVPKVNLGQAETTPGSLSDYLGIKAGGVPGTEVSGAFNVLPFAAYQKIWDDWYRDSTIQKPFFLEDGATQSEASGTLLKACLLPFSRNTGTMNSTSNYTSNNSKVGYNGRLITSLAQRNFAKDYYTTMTTQPQAGAASNLEFAIEVSGTTGSEGETMNSNGVGSFSIASLRAANSLQKWLERNNIAGTRYYEQILAHYGVIPPDANVDRAILLGSMTTPVIVNSLSQTTQATNTQTKNPYANSTGAQFGRGTGFGKDRLVNDFEVKEHGFIITIFSLVPHAYYSSGIRRYIGNQRFVSGQYAFPEFANIGDQAVKKSELYAPFYGSDSDTTIGYNQRYSEYKYHDDEVHGLLANGQSLKSFVLQKGFNSGVTVSSSLIEIPTSYMDDVMVTTAGVSGFNAIVDCYFDAKYLRVLPQYSLPSLCNDEDYKGKTVMVDYRGKRL